MEQRHGLSRADDFDNRLVQYEKQYRASVPDREREREPVRSLAYATAAGSALAMAGGAEAAVIMSGPQNIEISLPGPATNSIVSTSIDVDDDGTPDLRVTLFDSFNTNFFTFTTPSGTSFFTSFFSSQGAAISGIGSPAEAAIVVDSTSFGPAKFSSGLSVGPALNFASAAGNGVFNSGFDVELAGNPPNGNWAGSENGTIGFRLNKGGDVHYGWLRIELEDPFPEETPFSDAGDGLSDHATIVEWAYEDSPNTPITVPEPSGLAMLAAGCTALAHWRRRRQADESRVGRESADSAPKAPANAE